MAFGVKGDKKTPAKEYIKDGTRFKIIIQSRYDLAESVFNAFSYFVYFGGLGSKSRNGFGSLSLKNDEKLKQGGTHEIRDYSSLNNRSYLYKKFKEHSAWDKALSEIGLAYRTARLSIPQQKRFLIAKPIPQLKINERHSKPYFLHVNKLPNGKYKGQILFMPYKYDDENKREEYFKVCETINKKLTELCGGK